MLNKRYQQVIIPIEIYFPRNSAENHGLSFRPQWDRVFTQNVAFRVNKKEYIQYVVAILATKVLISYGVEEIVIPDTWNGIGASKIGKNACKSVLIFIENVLQKKKNSKVKLLSMMLINYYLSISKIIPVIHT